MKRWHLIGILILGMAFAACGFRNGRSVATQNLESPQPTADSALSAIDSLMWQRPDSALMCVISYFDTCCATDCDRHYAHLLLAELLYKNDYAQTNRADLLQAVAYFDSLLVVTDTRRVSADNAAITFLDARTHYINGVGYYEQDSAVEACKEYLKALDVMESHFKEKDLVEKKAQFMALTYTRLTELFSNLYLNQQTIYFSKRSLPYYEKYKTSPWHLSWMLSKIGVHYNLMDELDSATYYYQQAKTFLPDTNNMTYRDLAARQALLLYQRDRQSKKTILVLHQLANLAASDNERLARYLSIADVYYNERQFDSAKVYFERVYYNTQKSDIKMLTMDRLREILMAEGDTLKANKYASARWQFAVEKDKEGNLNSNLTTLCQQYEQCRQETQHKLKTQRVAKQWAIILGLTTFVVIVVLFLLMLLKRRIRNQQYSHMIQQAALSGRLRKSNEALRELKSQIKRQEDTPRPEGTATFAEEPVCRLIMERVKDGQFKSQMNYTFYKKYALNKEQLKALCEATDRHFEQFTVRLTKTYPNLTRTDLDYCCLYLLGLNEADISALMQRAYNTVNERSNK